jgi:hypothetical protein
MGEARQACVIDTAEFAVEMGGPRLHIRKCRYRAWIFLAPVEPGPSQELRAAIVDARGHAKAVQLYLMQRRWARRGPHCRHWLSRCLGRLGLSCQKAPLMSAPGQS